MSGLPAKEYTEGESERFLLLDMSVGDVVW